MWRRVALAVALVHLAKALSKDECYTIQCGQETSEKCIAVDSDSKTLTLSPCSDGLGCGGDLEQLRIESPFSEGSCVQQTSSSSSPSCPTFTQLNAGEYCCEDEDCYSGKCTNNECAFVEEGGECNSFRQCNINHYCGDAKCTAAKQEGASCSEHYECLTGYGCNSGTCTKLFSIDVDESASDGIFCKTILEGNGKCVGIKVYKEDQEISPPYECTLGETCEYKLEGYEEPFTTGECLCSGLPGEKGHFQDLQGLGYNYFASGDFARVYENLEFNQDHKCYGSEVYDSSISDMHECGAVSDDFYYYYTNITTQGYLWNLYHSGAIDGCSKDLGLFDPNYKHSDYETGSLLLGSLAILYFN